MTASKPIQMILARQLASSMATAIMLFDAQGNLVFYNEPAEPILNRASMKRAKSRSTSCCA